MKPSPVEKIAQELIHFPSITPAKIEVFDYVQQLLQPFDFTFEVMTFQSKDKEEVPNIFARYGNQGPHFCFAGHLDVVPPGPRESWKYDPFEGAIDNDTLYGRGAVDMKGAVAAFICSTIELIKQDRITGSISFLLTGDEEGEAIDGTKKAFEELDVLGQVPDFCLVGEPASEARVGDIIKIGSRGSLTSDIVVKGLQGHVAYPNKANNPIPKLVNFLTELNNFEWDMGTRDFDPTNLEVVSVQVNNITENMIPGQATARFNIRYNDSHSRESLIEEIKQIALKHIPLDSLQFNQGSIPYVSRSHGMIDRVKAVVESDIHSHVSINTRGGTSDARFIQNYCPVIELGLLSQTAHQVDEHVSIRDLKELEKIYYNIMTDFYSSL